MNDSLRGIISLICLLIPNPRDRAATICMEMPSTQPIRISTVHTICGSSRSTMTRTETKAVSAAQKVPMAVSSSAASIRALEPLSPLPG
jgi:hypothetical protein